MVLAEADWVAVAGAVGTLAVTVGGALIAWYLKIVQARSAEQRKTAAEQRKDRKDTVGELYDILEVQRKDRADDRELIHGLRDSLNQIQLKLAVCEHEREALTDRVAALEQRERRP
jgi:beta-phosphoglucomutase-like phosphatase (HAD superfamily)